MKYARFVALKVSEMLVIVFAPYLVGLWSTSWPDWMINIPLKGTEPLWEYWLIGCLNLLMYLFILPASFGLLTVAVMGIVYWNLKWAGFEPVWFWTETTSEDEDESDPE